MINTLLDFGLNLLAVAAAKDIPPKIFGTTFTRQIYLNFLL